MNPALAIRRISIPITQVIHHVEHLSRVRPWRLALGRGLHPHARLTGLASTFVLAGYPLMSQTFSPSGAPAQDWVSLASSADGTHLVAVASYGYLYLSEDSGASWTAANTESAGVEPERPWQAVASSGDGSRLVAVANFWPVFSSTNYGQTWTTNGPALDWAAVACSGDGRKIAAADYNMGGIYVSEDGGVSWTRTSAPGRRWRCLAMSADGKRLAAGTDYGDDYGQLPEMWISADSGVSWTLTSAPRETWQSVACSADGMKLAAAINGGGIYLSSNAGTNWTVAPAPALAWSSVCSSAGGETLFAAAWGGPILISSDSGRSWTNAPAPEAQWQTVACSSDGTRAAAGIWNAWADAPAGIYSGQGLSAASETAVTTGTGVEVVPAGPALEIKVAGGNAVISWPATAVGYRVQQSADAQLSTWADVSAAETSVDGKTLVAVPFEPGNHFFRLARP